MSEADNEYERQRQENILKNKQLLQQLQLDAGSLKPTRGGSSAASSRKSATPTPSKKRSKPVKKEEPAEPVIRRTSSRLAGLPAEHETAKRRRDEYELKLIEAERVKKMRVAGDLSFEIKQGLLDGVKKGTKWGRTFTEEDVKATTDKDVKRLREKMMGLKLYERFTPNGKCWAVVII